MTLGIGIHGPIHLGDITDGTTRSISEDGTTLGTTEDGTMEDGMTHGTTEDIGDGTDTTTITTADGTADGTRIGDTITDTDISADAITTTVLDMRQKETTGFSQAGQPPDVDWAQPAAQEEVQ